MLQDDQRLVISGSNGLDTEIRIVAVGGTGLTSVLAKASAPEGTPVAVVAKAVITILDNRAANARVKLEAMGLLAKQNDGWSDRYEPHESLAEKDLAIELQRLTLVALRRDLAFAEHLADVQRAASQSAQEACHRMRVMLDACDHERCDLTVKLEAQTAELNELRHQTAQLIVQERRCLGPK